MINYPCEFTLARHIIYKEVRLVAKLPFNTDYSYKNNHVRRFYSKWCTAGDEKQLEIEKEKLQKIVDEDVKKYDELPLRVSD